MLGVLKGAGVQRLLRLVLLRLVLNTVLNVLPLIAECASFQIGILSVNGNVSVSIITK